MKTTQFNFSKLISTAKYLGVATLFVGGLATFSGCAKKGCTDPTASNYDSAATEDDGTCEDIGIEGCMDPLSDNYDATATIDDGTCIDAGTKFIGTYKYNESAGTGCGGFTDWPATITISTTVGNKIFIDGFGAFQCSGTDIIVEAIADGQDVTVTSNQDFCGGGGASGITIVSGSGTMNASNTTFTISYTYQIAGSNSTCSGTYDKQ